ncbi:MAG: single-stranded DNA-binding protein [Deltaproteobacteria bacterium]|nr:single-stranded DNA-binding protein [Deltaproteobacteria bacterium]
MSRLGALKYTPSGMAVQELTIAVQQNLFGRYSVGHFEGMLVGELAETTGRKLRIGSIVAVEGSLWMREYRDRQGKKVNETKVIMDFIEVKNDEKK